MLKLTLMIALLGSTMIAGDMGSGGRECPPEGCTPPPCSVDCSGGLAMQSDETGSTVGSTDQTGGSSESIAIDLVKSSYLLFTF